MNATLTDASVHRSAAEYLRQITLARVEKVARVTPVAELRKLSARFGADIRVKREDLQPVHSYKLRGASHCLSCLSVAARAQGVVAASAGNHAQGVAFSARELGIDVTIVMPETTPDIKIEAVKALGARVILEGDTFDEASALAHDIAEREGLTLVPPFDHPDVITGQGTVARELLQQWADVDTVFIPVGGGGLLAGMAVYLKQVRPDLEIIAVEAEGSACFHAALEAGEPVPLASVDVFADGVAVRQMGAETFRIAREFTDHTVTVTTDQICAAIKDLFEDTRAIAEPAGAVALAGFKAWADRHDMTGRHVAVVLSGANLNFHTLRTVSERCEIGEGREVLLGVTIPEQPGSFRAFCATLEDSEITEFNYRANGRSEAHVFVGLRLGSAPGALATIVERLEGHGYAVLDLSANELAKLHVRHMTGAGGEHAASLLCNVILPAGKQGLLRFLTALDDRFDISLFHLRNHGASSGQALAGFRLAPGEEAALASVLTDAGLPFTDETDNPVAQLFLC